MPDEVKKPQTQVINELVKEGLNGVHEKVRAAIVANLVAEETSKRVKATTAVFQKIIAAEREAKKIKPKFLGFGADGKGLGDPVFTKEDADNLKKHTEQLQKLHGALARALEEGNFDKVFELAGGE